MEVKKGSGGTEALRNAVATAVGEQATVRTMGRSCTLQIRDLDEVTEEDEVVEAIVDCTAKEEITVRSLREALRETQTAVVTVPAKVAEKLLETGKIEVGWVVCRVRQKIDFLRCFRCLAPGHIAMDCKGTDRSKECRLCGRDDHFAKDCEQAPFCVICSDEGRQEDANHILGSSRCPSFEKARRPKPNG